MKIFCKCPTVNISKLNFWLVICIAKNFIWTTIFSKFRFVAPSDSKFSNSCLDQILSDPNKPYINGQLISFRFLLIYKWWNIPYVWFCGPGSHMVQFDNPTNNYNLYSIYSFFLFLVVLTSLIYLWINNQQEIKKMKKCSKPCYSLLVPDIYCIN